MLTLSTDERELILAALQMEGSIRLYGDGAAEHKARCAALAAKVAAAGATSPDGPYRPELAEAFREGARELLWSIQTGDNDRVAVDAAARVEEDEGGAIVHCVVFVSDSERPLMAGEEGEAAHI